MENWNKFLNEEEEVLEEGLAGTAAMAFFAAMTAKGLEPEITIDVGGEKIQISQHEVEILAHRVEGASDRFSDLGISQDKLTTALNDWLQAPQWPNPDYASAEATGPSLPSLDSVDLVSQAPRGVVGSFLQNIDAQGSTAPTLAPTVTTQQYTRGDPSTQAINFLGVLVSDRSSPDDIEKAKEGLGDLQGAVGALQGYDFSNMTKDQIFALIRTIQGPDHPMASP